MPSTRPSARGGEPEEVHSISGAQEAHSLGVDSRMKRYALKMALRVVCIVVAVLTHGWVMWAAVAGAAVLPWVAVVLANGTDKAEVRDVDYLLRAPRPELLSGPPETEAGRRAREAAAGPRPSDGSAAAGSHAASGASAHDGTGASRRPGAASAPAAAQDPADEVIEGEVLDSRTEKER